ncbi:MAG: class I SAM-dependent methyltransferase [bacterium]
MENFNKREAEWSEEKIKRFWDYFVGNPALLKLSFAEEVGRDIIKRTEKYLKPDFDILDYGCGGGALIGYLLDAGYGCQGLDSSVDSLEIVRKKFEREKLFKGAILSTEIPNKTIAPNFYNFIYSIEMIEHLLPDRIENYIKELERILKSGGYIFISTPYNENLKKYNVICPDCGAIFHRVQHLNSFTEKSLSALMEKNGFKTVFCQATLLENPSLVNKIKSAVRLLAGRKKLKQHLIYLGQKL